MIQDIISTYMVLPNRITVPLIGEVELAQLRFPMPKVNTHTLTHSSISSNPTNVYSN